MHKRVTSFGVTGRLPRSRIVCDDASSATRASARASVPNSERRREPGAVTPLDASMVTQRIVCRDGLHYRGVCYQHPYLRRIIGVLVKKRHGRSSLLPLTRPQQPYARRCWPHGPIYTFYYRLRRQSKKVSTLNVSSVFSHSLGRLLPVTKGCNRPKATLRGRQLTAQSV